MKVSVSGYLGFPASQKKALNKRDTSFPHAQLEKGDPKTNKGENGYYCVLRVAIESIACCRMQDVDFCSSNCI